MVRFVFHMAHSSAKGRFKRRQCFEGIKGILLEDWETHLKGKAMVFTTDDEGLN